MKKNNLKFLILLLLTIVIASCTSENGENSEIKEQKNLVNNTDYSSRITSEDTLYFEIRKNNYIISYSSKTINDSLTRSFTVSKNNSSLFNITYDFDTNREHWKLYQSDKVIEKADLLKDNQINLETLYDVKNLIDEYSPYIFSQIVNTKNENIVSSINYYNSIINTAIRSLKNNEDCNCTVHPDFLTDKTFFNCQEDHFYNVLELKNITNDYVSESTEIDSSTVSLIEFLETYEQQTINFNEVYSFYTSNEDYQIFIDNQKTYSGGDCAWWCPLGCGSDWDVGLIGVVVEITRGAA